MASSPRPTPASRRASGSTLRSARSEEACSLAPAEVLSVLVFSPLRYVADALAAELSRHPGVRAHAFTDVAAPNDPEVVLVEVHAPAGVDTLRHCRDRFPKAVVVAVGIEESPQLVLECVAAGAAAYVPEQATLADLVSAVEQASRGEAMGSPLVVGELFRRFASGAGRESWDPVAAVLLTGREREVAGMLSQGFSNKAIARRLGIRLPTVKSHVHQVLRKLGASSRTSLIRSRGSGDHPSASPGI